MSDLDHVELLRESPRAPRRSRYPYLVMFLVVLMAAVISVIMFSLQVHGGPPSFRNPLVARNAPDPGVLEAGGTYYTVTTSGTIGVAQDAFPILCGSAIDSWSLCGTIFAGNAHPTWTNGVDFIAPELHLVGDRFVAYFTARHRATGMLAVGVATSDKAKGPYSDAGEPLVLDPTVGNRDATVFYDPATDARYVAWKVDSDVAAPGQGASIVMQRLADNGLARVGARLEVLAATLDWEEGVVRAPWILQRRNMYYLFYSGASEFSAASAISVARSERVTGPFEKMGSPLLATGRNSTNPWSGPGHCAVVLVRGNTGAPGAAYMRADGGSSYADTDADAVEPWRRPTQGGSAGAGAAAPGTRASAAAQDQKDGGGGASGDDSGQAGASPTSSEASHFIIYSAWKRGSVGGHYPRLMLGDRLRWKDGWPSVRDGVPSSTSQNL